MKKINIILIIFLIIFTISACSSSKSLLNDKIEARDINKIQIVLAMGNPKYGAESKIITDKNEISQIVDAFNNAVIGKKVKDDNIVISDTSQYYFYMDDTLVHKFSFNGNDSERIWYNSDWYYINYSHKKPYELYKSSLEEIIIVDENLNEMERPARKVLTEEVKRITPDMKYNDIINLLGYTNNIGSGIYVLKYIVDKDKILLISLMSKDTPCGKSGEELLQTTKFIKK